MVPLAPERKQLRKELEMRRLHNLLEHHTLEHLACGLACDITIAYLFGLEPALLLYNAHGLKPEDPEWDIPADEVCVVIYVEEDDVTDVSNADDEDRTEKAGNEESLYIAARGMATTVGPHHLAGTLATIECDPTFRKNFDGAIRAIETYAKPGIDPRRVTYLCISAIMKLLDCQDVRKAVKGLTDKILAVWENTDDVRRLINLEQYFEEAELDFDLQAEFARAAELLRSSDGSTATMLRDHLQQPHFAIP